MDHDAKTTLSGGHEQIRSDLNIYWTRRFVLTDLLEKQLKLTAVWNRRSSASARHASSASCTRYAHNTQVDSQVRI